MEGLATLPKELVRGRLPRSPPCSSIYRYSVYTCQRMSTQYWPPTLQVSIAKRLSMSEAPMPCIAWKFFWPYIEFLSMQLYIVAGMLQQSVTPVILFCVFNFSFISGNPFSCPQLSVSRCISLWMSYFEHTHASWILSLHIKRERLCFVVSLKMCIFVVVWNY